MTHICLSSSLQAHHKSLHSQGHLAEKEIFPNPLNTDLSRGFTVSRVAEKHNWPLPLVWSLALEGKDDHKRFKQLTWGLRAEDLWGWPDCDKRFGVDWPDRIPAQLIGHLLYYFSKQNDLVFDPMAGGGVIPTKSIKRSVAGRFPH